MITCPAPCIEDYAGFSWKQFIFINFLLLMYVEFVGLYPIVPTITGVATCISSLIAVIMYLTFLRNKCWHPLAKITYMLGVLWGVVLFIGGATGSENGPLYLSDGIILVIVHAMLLWRTAYRAKTRETGYLLSPSAISSFKQSARRTTISKKMLLSGTAVLLWIGVAYIMPRADPYTREIATSDGDLSERFAPPDCFLGWIQSALTQSRVQESYGCNHPFGTDKNGRNVMRRLAHAASTTIVASLLAVGIAIAGGTGIGVAAGYLGGWTDTILMRLIDILLAFPQLLLAMAIVAIRGPGLENAILAVGIIGIPSCARLVRSRVLGLRELEFIVAAESLGATTWQILRIHIFPNTLSLLIVQSTLAFGTAIIEISALGFLGLGQLPPLPELGKMMLESREVILSGQWWITFFPGAVIFSIIVSFNLFGDSVRDFLDPRFGTRV